MGSVPWTCHQEEVLREYAHGGVAAVRVALVRECGVERSLRAIEVRASRLHVSLRTMSVCPMCGVLGAHLNRISGMCVRCTEEAHVAEERAFHDVLELEAAGHYSGPDIAAARREYVRLRQVNSRLRRKYGLAGKREREEAL